MRTRTMLISSIVMTAALGAPAQAVHGPTGDDFEPNLRLEQVWFRCGDHRVHPGSGNVAFAGPIAWDTTKPSQSTQEGAGCAVVDNAFHGNNQVSVQDAHFGGTFVGNLDALTVDVYALIAGPRTVQSGSFIVHARLLVDDINVLGVNGKEVSVTPLATGDGRASALRFSVTDIGLLDEPNDSEHTVLLTLTGGAVVSGQVRDTNNVFLYDASDRPSGLVFNPTTLESARVKRA